MNLSADKIWLYRGVFLAWMVGFWLGYADTSARWRVDDDLLARGKSTVANPQKGLDRWLPQGSVLSFKEHALVLKRKKPYSFMVEGHYYEEYTTGKEDPVGQTITYLPEDPTVHRLGVIEPRSMAIKACGTVFFAGLTGLLTLGFFAFCVLPPGADNPTRQGWWIILGLSIAQLALVFTTLYLVRQPFLAILALYVPAFVGGSIATILCVRFFAWRWNIKLSNLTAAIEPKGKRGHRRFS